MSSTLAPDANRDKVALITGGGTGIGRATALAFAGSGARVAICGRRPEPLDGGPRRARARRRRMPRRAVRRPRARAGRALVDAVVERFGGVDVLVNNAGGQFTAPAEEITSKGMRAVHRLAIDAAWDLTREVATRSMIPGGGGLIVFLGFSPRRGIPGFAHASAARAALENLAQGLLEWSRHSIRAVCVVVGNIDTEGLAAYGAEAVEAARRQVPLGRLGEPREVAETIAFLASAAARTSPARAFSSTAASTPGDTASRRRSADLEVLLGVGRHSAILEHLVGNRQKPGRDRERGVHERKRDRQAEEADGRERDGDAPAIDVIGHRAVEQGAAPGVPEQHDLHPADRRDGGRVHDDRERVLEVVAAARRRGRRRRGVMSPARSPLTGGEPIRVARRRTRAAAPWTRRPAAPSRPGGGD